MSVESWTGTQIVSYNSRRKCETCAFFFSKSDKPCSNSRWKSYEIVWTIESLKLKNKRIGIEFQKRNCIAITWNSLITQKSQIRERQTSKWSIHTSRKELIASDWIDSTQNWKYCH